MSQSSQEIQVQPGLHHSGVVMRPRQIMRDGPSMRQRPELSLMFLTFNASRQCYQMKV